MTGIGRAGDEAGRSREIEPAPQADTDEAAPAAAGEDDARREPAAERTIAVSRDERPGVGSGLTAALFSLFTGPDEPLRKAGSSIADAAAAGVEAARARAAAGATDASRSASTAPAAATAGTSRPISPARSEETFPIGEAPRGGRPDRVFVSFPENPERFRNADGSLKPPRMVVYFPGNGQRLNDALPFLKAEVKRMREQGDPVILVVPEDNHLQWGGFDDPERFGEIVRTVEEKAGGPVGRDITLAAFSGGYRGLGKSLGLLQGRGLDRPDGGGAVDPRLDDPEHRQAYLARQADLYDRVRGVALFDAAYGHWDELAEFGSDPRRRLSSNYTDHLADANRRLREAIAERRGADLEGVRIEPFRGHHGNAPTRFRDYTAPPDGP